MHSEFSLFKFLIKPDSLLLEDQRSETGSEGHIETTLLFIDLNNKKHFASLSLTGAFSMFNTCVFV